MRLANADYGLLTERFCVSIQGKELPDLVKNNRVDGIFLAGGLFIPELIVRLKEKRFQLLRLIVIMTRLIRFLPMLLREYILGFGICWIKDSGKSAILIVRKFTVLTRNVWREFKKPIRFHLQMKPDWLVYCKHNTGEGGYEAIKRLWQSGARLQAIAAANEPIALGIMRFLYEQDIRISEDIAIVS